MTRIGELGTLAVTNNQRTLRIVLRLLVIANVVPSLPSLVNMTMEAIHSSETSVLNKTHTA
jgi:hypothetical protein